MLDPRREPAALRDAARLLERGVGDAGLDEATDLVARPAQTAASAPLSAIVFRLGQDWFALSPLACDEITEPQAIRSLPHRRGAVLGLANVRGELIACLSLSRVLGLPAGEEPMRGRRLLVLPCGAGRIAVPVDEVRSLHVYAEADVQPLPATVARSAANLTDGLLPWCGRWVGRLEPVRLAGALNGSLA